MQVTKNDRDQTSAESAIAKISYIPKTKAEICTSNDFNDEFIITHPSLSNAQPYKTLIRGEEEIGSKSDNNLYSANNSSNKSESVDLTNAPILNRNIIRRTLKLQQISNYKK